MTKFLPNLVAPLLLIGAIGCSDRVVLDAPIGEPLSREAGLDFVGTWVDNDSGAFELRQKKDGGFVAAALFWNEQKQQFEVETLDIELRSIGKSVFWVLQDHSDSDYDFYRIEKKGEEVTIHSPDPAKYRQAVEKNLLAGKIESPNNRFTVRVEVNARLTTEFFGAADLSGLDLKEDTSIKLRRIKTLEESTDDGFDDFDDLLIER